MIANYGNAVAPIVPYIFGQTFTFRNKDGPFRVVRLETLRNASCGLFSARFFFVRLSSVETFAPN